MATRELDDGSGDGGNGRSAVYSAALVAIETRDIDRFAALVERQPGVLHAVFDLPRTVYQRKQVSRPWQRGNTFWFALAVSIAAGCGVSGLLLATFALTAGSDHLDMDKRYYLGLLAGGISELCVAMVLVFCLCTTW